MPFTVSVNTLDGRSCQVSTDANQMSGADLRREISEKLDIDLNLVRILYSGHLIADDYILQENCTVQVVTSPPPSRPQTNSRNGSNLTERLANTDSTRDNMLVNRSSGVYMLSSVRIGPNSLRRDQDFFRLRPNTRQRRAPNMNSYMGSVFRQFVHLNNMISQHESIVDQFENSPLAVQLDFEHLREQMPDDHPFRCPLPLISNNRSTQNDPANSENIMTNFLEYSRRIEFNIQEIMPQLSTFFERLHLLDNVNLMNLFLTREGQAYFESSMSLMHSLSHTLHCFSNIQLFDDQANDSPGLRVMLSEDYINGVLNDRVNHMVDQHQNSIVDEQQRQNQTNPTTHIHSSTSNIYMISDNNLHCHSRHYVSEDNSQAESNVRLNRPIVGNMSDAAFLTSEDESDYSPPRSSNQDLYQIFNRILTLSTHTSARSARPQGPNDFLFPVLNLDDCSWFIKPLVRLLPDEGAFIRLMTGNYRSNVERYRAFVNLLGDEYAAILSNPSSTFSQSDEYIKAHCIETLFNSENGNCESKDIALESLIAIYHLLNETEVNLQMILMYYRKALAHLANSSFALPLISNTQSPAFAILKKLLIDSVIINPQPDVFFEFAPSAPSPAQANSRLVGNSSANENQTQAAAPNQPTQNTQQSNVPLIPPIFNPENISAAAMLDHPTSDSASWQNVNMDLFNASNGPFNAASNTAAASNPTGVSSSIFGFFANSAGNFQTFSSNQSQENTSQPSTPANTSNQPQATGQTAANGQPQQASSSNDNDPTSQNQHPTTQPSEIQSTQENLQRIDENSKRFDEFQRKYAGLMNMPHSTGYNMFSSSTKRPKNNQSVFTPETVRNADEMIESNKPDETTKKSILNKFYEHTLKQNNELMTLSGEQRSNLVQSLTDNEQMKQLITSSIRDRAKVDPNFSSEEFPDIARLIKN